MSNIFEEKLKALGNNFSADVLILSKHYPIAEAAQKAFDNNRATIEAFLNEARIFEIEQALVVATTKKMTIRYMVGALKRRYKSLTPKENK